MDPTTPSRADAVVTRPLRYGWSPPAPLTPQAMHGEAVIDAATRAANEITILIVENEESNRMLMEEILRFAGYRCVLACNGLEALEVFEREHPHIILTDVSMPVMDGYEATMAIRGRPGGARVPIVAVTAHAMSGERERALRRGCTDYLAKPYRPHELLEVVERQLNKGSMQGGGSSSCGGGV
jgi:CheY-like chemotaxis protein